MGENKHIKELDAFAKKYVKEIPQEQPSIDFTSNLMQKIAIETKSSVFKTQALISKQGWFAVVLLVIVTLFLAFNSSDESSLNLPQIDLNVLSKLQFSDVLENLSFSNITLYAFVFFGLMIAIQFTYLKQYFDKNIG